MVGWRETLLRKELVKARVKILYLRESLETILEEAESDHDRDVIITECRTTLREEERKVRG